MIRASFHSECKCCERKIEPGERIGLVDGEWCCEECVDEHGEDGADG